MDTLLVVLGLRNRSVWVPKTRIDAGGSPFSMGHRRLGGMP